ncbi:hypothetical protein [Catellatospora bangladeshensis]|uniref:Uncharacterized protein n=1 Tax=Catellatospora bangladeshensis TaxID=310355 RepID=A0A8J3NIZ3_9ACTN|nr:hypothetical protein [Catellatospora bangladeshensis]GIF82945.1 hypothetical protein Cba03nite_42940 [Catellatospora bangladeshensis]
MLMDVLPEVLPWAATAETAETPALSVGLAVEDFAPTLFAFVGFLLLAPSWLGRIGAVLMGAGGAAKSTWKLLHAAWAIEVPWLDDLLFPLLAAGGLLLALSLHGSLRWWRWPLLIAGAAAGGLAVAERSVQPTFVFATVIVVWISVLGSVRAWRHGTALAAGLFSVSLLAVMALIPLRGHAASDALMFQWVQQGINTMAQGVFCLAAWLTYRAVRGHGTDFAHRADDFDAPAWPRHDQRASYAAPSYSRRPDEGYSAPPPRQPAEPGRRRRD